MTSKRVLQQQRSVVSVAAALDTHGPRVSSALHALLAPLLEPGESMPDLLLVLRLLNRLTQRRLDHLITADQALAVERVQDDSARAARDRLTKTLYEALTDLSEVVGFIYGDRARAMLHLDGTTPRDHTTLCARAALTADALSSASLSLPPPKRANVPFDAASHARDLRAHITALTQAITAVAADTRETERALLDRDTCQDALHCAFIAVANIFEHTCRLTDDAPLAARIRHASSRPGNTTSDPAASPPAPPAAPSA